MERDPDWLGPEADSPWLLKWLLVEVRASGELIRWDGEEVSDVELELRYDDPELRHRVSTESASWLWGRESWD